MSPLLPGAWARAEGVVGVVAAVDADGVAVFSPVDRRVARVPAEAVELLPAGGVTAEVTLTLPLPHGLSEAELRRWLAALIDPVLRERAAEALRAAGLDTATAEPSADVVLREADAGGIVCVAGHRSAMTASPAAPGPDAELPAGAGVAAAESSPGAAVPCPECGRAAYPPPRRSDDQLRTGR